LDIVAIPGTAHVAAVVVIVGTGGIVNCAAILKDPLAADVHDPLLVVTVYDVPAIIPEIAPPTPVVGPAGVNV
jgi:hypothetical protein